MWRLALKIQFSASFSTVLMINMSFCNQLAYYTSKRRGSSSLLVHIGIDMSRLSVIIQNLLMILPMNNQYTYTKHFPARM